jgi:hypothetical protein
MSRFEDAISGTRPASPLLPLLHTTDGYSFRSIIEKEKLEPRPCTVFREEEILYLFYGKPSFRPHSKEQPNAMPAFYPVSFIIRPGAIENVKRIFPFDSGAFENGLFDRFLYRRQCRGSNHQGMCLDDFEVTASLDSARKIVDTFFQTNQKYYDGQATSVPDVNDLNFELESYRQLIHHNAKDYFDERCKSIEIQMVDSIKLNASTVDAVILPSIFLEDKTARERLTVDWKADIYTYNPSRGNPDAYCRDIYVETRRHLMGKGLLDEV